MDHVQNRLIQTGNICVQWANLEYHLAVTIWVMAGVESEVGKILTGGMDMKTRASAAVAISHQMNAPRYLKMALAHVLKQLRDGGLIDRRNQAVHGVHMTSELPNAAKVELHRGKGGRQPRLQMDAELADLNQRLSSLCKTFDVSMARYIEERLGTGQAGVVAMRAMVEKMRETMAEGETSEPS